MNLIATKLISKSIEAAFAEAGKIYSNNPEALIEINIALARITLEMQNLIDNQKVEDTEDVYGLVS